MPKRPKKAKRQIDEFRKAARELGADESEERFQSALRKIAKQRPKGEPEPVKPQRR